jgi:hypothetical protein
MSLEKVKEFYASFDDSKIERMALHEAGGLEPEGLQILIDEIKKRGLSPKLLEAIKAQTTQLTIAEKKIIQDEIIHLPCPICSDNTSVLQGRKVRSVVSMIFVTSSELFHQISCKSCLKTLKKKAIITTSLLGWWGFPMGPFKTINAIVMTLVENKKVEPISEKIISDFIDQNIGEISANMESTEKIVQLMSDKNKIDKNAFITKFTDE